MSCVVLMEITTSRTAAALNTVYDDESIIAMRVELSHAVWHIVRIKKKGIFLSCFFFGCNDAIMEMSWQLHMMSLE
jgi:hypothetical protein